MLGGVNRTVQWKQEACMAIVTDQHQPGWVNVFEVTNQPSEWSLCHQTSRTKYFATTLLTLQKMNAPLLANQINIVTGNTIKPNMQVCTFLCVCIPEYISSKDSVELGFWWRLPLDHDGLVGPPTSHDILRRSTWCLLPQHQSNTHTPQKEKEREIKLVRCLVMRISLLLKKCKCRICPFHVASNMSVIWTVCTGPVYQKVG